MKRKLMRSGNGWALFMSKTLIELLKIQPEEDFLELQIENDILKISKSTKE